jgi:hypothetical protein
MPENDLLNSHYEGIAFLDLACKIVFASAAAPDENAGRVFRYDPRSKRFSETVLPV